MNGIQLYGKNNLLINNTCIYNEWYGIGFSNADSNNIINNTCDQNEIGIYLRYADLNIISNNSCNLNEFSGIEFDHSYENIIGYNIFCENNYGIRLGFKSERNIFNNNVISDNLKCGISIITNDNYIFHNHFINNTNQTKEIGENFWNNSAHEGNYWSDYTGVDNGADSRPKGDGIGDTKLPHQGVDYYPFVNPGATTEDDGDGGDGGGGGDESWLGLNFSTCRTLSILLIILLIVLLLIFRKILPRSKAKKK